ncbi:hypothetical protein JXA47_04265, partial [Candidatus Sumerlaeota bacterium]|nr:hypothetical protein [Candidatus Sumerlaeota bacterium]
MFRTLCTKVLCLLAVTAVPAQVGRLDLHASVDPQPDFLIDPASPAVMSPDGRFVFLVSPGVVATFDSAVVSARLRPGGAQIVSRIGQGTTRIEQLALSRDGGRLAAVGSSGTAIFFDVDPLTGALQELGSFSQAANVSADHQPIFNAEGTALHWGDSNAPGRLRVLDADPAGGIDTTPLQEITLGSDLEAFRMALSEDGGTLVVAAANRVASAADSLIVYDVAPSTGLLSEWVRYEPGRDLGWGPSTNPVVSADGLVGHVIDVVAEQVIQLDLSTSLTVLEISQSATPPLPMTLAQSGKGNALLCVAPSAVGIFGFDTTGDLVSRGVFAPAGVTFAAENNAVLNDSGTLGFIASNASDRIFTFHTADGNAASPRQSSMATLSGPTAIASGFNFRRLLVNAADADQALAYTVEPLEPHLILTTELTGVGTSYDLSHRIVVDPLGQYAHATSLDPFLTTDVLASGPQSTPVLSREPYGGGEVVMSADGQVLAAGAMSSVSIYTDPLAGAPSGIFDPGMGFFGGARMAISADGSRLYVPNSSIYQIHVVDTARTGTFSDTVQTVSVGGSVGSVVLSADGSRLAHLPPGSTDLVMYDVSTTDGTLSNERLLTPVSNLHNIEDAVYLEASPRVIVGDGGGYLHLFDLASGSELDNIQIGTGYVGTMTPVPHSDLVLVLSPFDQTATVVEALADNTLVELGRLQYLTLDQSSRAVVTPDGMLGVIPNASPSAGAGVHLMEIWRPGPTTSALDFDETGTTGQVAIGGGGTHAASIDTLNDRVVIHRIARGAPPRLTRAVLLEDEASTDGIGQEGEILLLSFSRAVLPRVGAVDPYDFHLPGGGDLGSTAQLMPGPSDSNQATIVLGSEPNIDATDTTHGIDIGAAASKDLFPALFDLVPAIDLGQENIDDAGIDIEQQLGTQTTPITAPSGGAVTLPAGPAYAFTGHRFDVPANALRADANFTLGPPPLSYFGAGLSNAVALSTDAADPLGLFQSAAFLTLEYDPLAFSTDAGQLEHLMRIVQIIPDGGGFILWPVPGQPLIDTEANTITLPLAAVNLYALSHGSTSGISRHSEDPQAGVYATLPVNPVEERTIYVTAGSAAAAMAASDESACITPNSGSAYTQHRIEFPGYELTTESDPNRIAVTVSTSTIFERVSMSGGTSFPTQSGAVFTVTTEDASGNPVSFTDPVNITVEFIDRASDSQTDCVDFTSTCGDPCQMCVVCNTDTGGGVDFENIGGSATGSLVTLDGFTPLTGA